MMPACLQPVPRSGWPPRPQLIRPSLMRDMVWCLNPPHPGRRVRENCLEPFGLSVTVAAQVLGRHRPSSPIPDPQCPCKSISTENGDSLESEREAEMLRVAILFLAIFLAGCGNEPQSPPPIKLPVLVGNQDGGNFRLLIAVCSAGLNDGTRNKIFAEVDRRGGILGWDFQKLVQGAIFSDESIESSDKVKLFEAYLKCVDGTGNSTGTKCQKIADSCVREQDVRLKSCLENARSRCIRDCVLDHGFETARCVSELCNPNAKNMAYWVAGHCEIEQDDFLACEAKFRSCISR